MQDELMRSAVRTTAPLLTAALLLLGAAAAGFVFEPGLIHSDWKPAAREVESLLTRADGVMVAIRRSLADIAIPAARIEELARRHPPPPPSAPDPEPEPEAPSAAPVVAALLPPPPPEAPKVTGIAWISGRPLLLAGGRLVGLGDVLEGFKVVALRKDTVTFESPKGARITLHVFQEVRP